MLIPLWIACIAVDAEVPDRGGPAGGGTPLPKPEPTVPICAGEVAAHLDDQPFDRIQDAIDAAPVGATVGVCPGFWDANLVIERDLTLVGDEGRRATTIDAALYVRTVTLRAGTVTLRGLRLTGASTQDAGAAVLIEPGAAGVIEDCTLTRGETYYGVSGGGLFVGPGASATIRSSKILDNLADSGGGAIYAAEGAVVDVIDTALTGNSAGRGGALWVSDGAIVTVAGTSSVTGNEAYFSGGGAYIVGTGRLVSEGADWGAGDGDNEPADVGIDGMTFGPYGAGASFVCELGSCTP